MYVRHVTITATRFSMNLFRATTHHGSMVIIINVDDEQRIVSSASFATKRDIICSVRSNVEYAIRIRILSIGRISKSR